jgi:hypothetical protein
MVRFMVRYMRQCDLCYLVQDFYSLSKLLVGLGPPLVSATAKGGLHGPADINIAQILHLSNFFELKRRVYIHLQA